MPSEMKVNLHIILSKPEYIGIRLMPEYEAKQAKESLDIFLW